MWTPIPTTTPTKRTLESYFTPPISTTDCTVSKKRKLNERSRDTNHGKTVEEPIEIESDDDEDGDGDVHDDDDDVSVIKPKQAQLGDILQKDGPFVEKGNDQKSTVIQVDSPLIVVTPHTEQRPPSTHPTYPFPIPSLPSSLSPSSLSPSTPGQSITDKPHLDLLVYQPFLEKKIAKIYGEHLRGELPFYRVRYTTMKFGKELVINTPRWTTVFGIDSTSLFTPTGDIIDCKTQKPIAKNKYKCKPRPIPECLQILKKITEQSTSTTYNFALVNFYANGSDSISYHSDDESFLEHNPAIASFSFGTSRDFFLKPKTPPNSNSASSGKEKEKPLKFILNSGTMILMKGETQRNWLHSIPKRVGGDKNGRINVTFRKNLKVAGTENYYRYNVGDGQPHKWDSTRMEMVPLAIDVPVVIPTSH